MAKIAAKKKIGRDVLADHSFLNSGSIIKNQNVGSEPATAKITFKSGYGLIPVNDIVVLPGANEFSSVGNDPGFVVLLSKKHLKAGWYWLSVEIKEIQGIILMPKLYFDAGQGFNEENVCNLPALENGRIEGLVKLPFSIMGLRFDPTISVCTFSVNDFLLKHIGKIKAFRIGVTKYKQINGSGRNNLVFYSGLTTSFLKSQLRKKIRDSIAFNDEGTVAKYKKWCVLYDTISPDQLLTIESLARKLSYQPLFSVIVPVYNAPVIFLRKAIDSVRNQAYKNWELCIADDKSTQEEIRNVLHEYTSMDKRIKVTYREVNGHISNASNSALDLATGDYIVLLDQDDELPRHCLYMAAEAINVNKDLELIYSDEDKIDEEGNRFDPYFKTDWNKDLFYGQNLISHLGVYKHSLIKKIGGFRPGYEGSQDYDLALRCIEHLRPHQIHHLPHVLYHWRAIEGSTSVSMSNKNYAFDSGLKALQDHLRRTCQKAIAEPNIHNSYRVKWDLPLQEPLVSIIIPTKNKVNVLSACVTSILQKTTYNNFEILIIDNNSDESETLAYFKKIQQQFKQITVYGYAAEFNFSAMVNYGVRQSKGEVVLLLNNDTEVINEDWLREMVSQCMRTEIGAVGAKLFYPNGQIQHAGVFLYEGHPGNHIYLKRSRTDPGYFNKLNLVQNYSAITAACLAIRKELYLQVDGFDDKNLKIVYNDVDFCLKVKELGYTNLWTPFAQLYHHESLSRGNDLDEANLERFKKEHAYILKKWKSAVSSDPFFNPNLNPAFDPSSDPSVVRFAFPPLHQYEWQKVPTKVNIKQPVKV